MKWLAVVDHPYYPEVKEFGGEGEAELYLEEIKEEIGDERGRYEGNFYTARVHSQFSCKVLY